MKFAVQDALKEACLPKIRQKKGIFKLKGREMERDKSKSVRYIGIDSECLEDGYVALKRKLNTQKTQINRAMWSTRVDFTSSRSKVEPSKRIEAKKALILSEEQFARKTQFKQYKRAALKNKKPKKQWWEWDLKLRSDAFAILRPKIVNKKEMKVNMYSRLEETYNLRRSKGK